MAESYFQLQPDGSGIKMREILRTIGSDAVRSQGVFQGALDTWAVQTDEVVPATNLQHFTVWNPASSGVMLSIKKLFILNFEDTNVAGGRLRFDVKRISAITSPGTGLTINGHDSNNTSLPSGVVAYTGASVTESSLLFPLTFSNEEQLTIMNSLAQLFMQGNNWLPEGQEIQELRLRESEGLSVKQISAATVGRLGWYCVFTSGPLD